MVSVALIGGDGAGKTTIATRLVSLSPLSMKYMYMGTSLRSANHSLLTSRLLLLVKQRAYSRRMRESGIGAIESIPAHYMEYEKTERGPIWTAFRHLYRFVEAWYRQIISLWYQVRGYVVVYDRHILFDSAPPASDGRPLWQVRLDALNYWILSSFFPKPHLTVFLDAPAEVLYARKGEATPEYLGRQRQAFRKQGKRVNNFVRVDATQPLDKVLEEVTQHIMEFHAAKCHHTADGDA